MPSASGTAIKAISSGLSDRKVKPPDRAVQALVRASKAKTPFKRY